MGKDDHKLNHKHRESVLIALFGVAMTATAASTQFSEIVQPLAMEALAPALSSWPNNPAPLEQLLHRPRQLELQPVVGTPYFVLQEASRMSSAVPPMSPADNLHFVCPVAAPRFTGGLVTTELVRYEVDSDSGHAFMHLASCETTPAPWQRRLVRSF